jgi:hypothetical protein
MTSYAVLIDGQPTGYTLMAESAREAVDIIVDSWSEHMERLGKFRQYGKFGVVTCKGPVRFPDGYQDIAHG